MAKKKYKTKSGFAFEMDDRIKTDWRLVQAMSLLQSDDQTKNAEGLIRMTELVLGKNVDKFYEFTMKKNDGYIPVESVSELFDCINEDPEIKN